MFNPKHKRYNDYGGRGITIQENWIKDFRSFYEYVISLPNYSINNTLDRINNDLGYFEGNLRWANYQTQSENRRVPKHNTTGFKGIQIRKSTGKYKVDITVNKKRIYLGDYENIEDAIEARKIYITKNNLNHN